MVQDQDGRWGGVFVDRTAALKFAMSENGRPQAVVMVPYPLELAITERPTAGRRGPAGACCPAPRRVAASDRAHVTA